MLCSSSWTFFSFLLLFVRANWPVFDSSTIQIAGLFSDPENTSEPNLSSVQRRAMFKSAIILATQQSNLTIDWKTVQTGGNFITAFSKLCSLMIKSNIIGIIGPEYSREAHVIANFAQYIGIPAISYAATNPDLSDRSAYPTFYRTVPSDAFAAIAMIQLFIRYNWTSCVIIYQNDEFGSGGNDAIRNEFDKNGLLIVESIVFDLITTSIRGDLKEILLGSPSRIVILWVFEEYTPLILREAVEQDVVGPRFTWISRSKISFETFNQTSSDKLIGLLLLEPTSSQVIHEPYNFELFQSAIEIWQTYEPETYPQSNVIDDYALYTFDATWTLIQALTRLSDLNLEMTNSTSCYQHRFLNISSLFTRIDETDFLGVSGRIKFNPNTTDRVADGIYFLLQNIQPFQNGIGFIPVLQWTYANQWQTYTRADVIIWPGNTLEIPSGSAGLQGIHLNICMIESAPFTMSVEMNSTKSIGYIPDLLDILVEKSGFIPHIRLVSTNVTYNGLIQSVADGICDIAMGDITVTSNRRELADFSNSIFDNSLRIVIRQSSTVIDTNLFSYFRPFSRNLWLVILFSIILATILLCLIERKENDALKNKPLISSAAMSLWFSLGTMMGYGADFNVRTAAGRLLSIGLYMLSLVFVATYTANLTSDLTLAKTRDFITGIDDLQNGKIAFNRIGLVVGSAIVDYYLREISYGRRNFYACHTNDEAAEYLKNGTIDAIIADAAWAEYATSNIYCDLTTIGTDFSRSIFGIVMPKNWIYSKDLDIVILSLREAGVLDNLRKKWFQANVCENSDDTTNVSTRISLQSMTGLFFTFAVICVLSILLHISMKRFTFLV